MPVDPRRILFEDDYLLIVNKLAGELVVAADGEGKLPLFDFLAKDYPGLKVVHRIDYQTSGVVVFAKTAAAVAAIRASKFADWEKTYRAIVAGQVTKPTGTIDNKLPARTKDDLVPAVSHYRTVTVYRDATDVEVKIETGRKHQIRQHMAAIGHPLLRDPLYGNRRADETFARRYGFSKFFLHAIRLSFPHPILPDTRVSVSAPLPPSWRTLLEKLAHPPVATPLAQRRSKHMRPQQRQKKVHKGPGGWSGQGLRRARGQQRKPGRRSGR